ncbi:MAG: efflux RND transporter periplasmic adaptor subunit, partial [Pseudomonadota bacterium]
MRARTVLYAFAMLAAAAGVGGYLFNEAQPQVAVARVARGPAVAGVYATGTVEPVAWAKVGP